MITIKKLGELIGCETLWYNETESTNDLAHTAIINNCVNGSVFIADVQTKGRGQRSNSWESEPSKNLTFSVILYPEFLKVEEQFLLSKAISVAVVDFLKECGLTAKIKWPNDIYVGDKKITGILIEHSITANNIASSIVGVGLNVNQKTFLSDAPNPTSILIALGREKELDRAKSLERLLFLFEQRYKSLMTSNFEKLEKDYFQHLYHNDGFYQYISAERKFAAKIIGITNIGELLLETENGEQQKFGFKEISFVV
ncbi:MAG: biotin--[acetyl-CoA-carboxylase] ligase [Prevotellaceae bacterium]|jgi:BirA family biotin operon repressor/biotin-[acetyl-CoA-carboxylase] ligase|nr:biotin--[acetyl-CoA-carboxylase] ligase [Prevotellaceae bacterium]